MEEKRDREKTRFNSHPEDEWLCAALEPEPDTAGRLVEAVLAMENKIISNSTAVLWRAAAVIVLGLSLMGAFLLLRPQKRKITQAGVQPQKSYPGTEYLISNASGKLELVQVKESEQVSRRPIIGKSYGNCVTVLMNQGDVYAVFDTCAEPRVLIEGGT